MIAEKIKQKSIPKELELWKDITVKKKHQFNYKIGIFWDIRNRRLVQANLII